jgi:hypothetical protein
MTDAISAASGSRENEGKPMMRFLALVAVAGIAVALYAATAGGGQQAVTPKQFAALKKQVTTLQKDVKSLKVAITRITAAGVVDAGDGQTTGYHYKQPDGTEILTSALDVAVQGETPTGYLAALNPQCVQTSSFRLAHFRTGAARH